MKAPLPANESARLEALRQYNILDTAAERAFDDLTLLATQICQTPVALVSLIDDNRQWFKSCVGINAQETPRDAAFCAHAIGKPDLLIVPDARADERFADSPLVTGEPHIRFYAGAPLVTNEGYALGTLCLIDYVPRDLTSEQQEALRALSHQVMTQLELRRQSLALTSVNKTLREAEARHRIVLETASDSIITIDQENTILFINEATVRIFGYTAAEMIGGKLTMLMPDYLRHVHDASIKRYMQTGQRHIAWEAVEVPGLHKSGREIPLEISFGEFNNDGKRIFTGIIRDVTERRRAEEALKKSEEYRNLFRHANDAILIFEPETEIVLDVNDKGCEVYGFSREEFIGRSLKEMSLDVTEGERQLAELLSEGTQWEFETTQLRADGTPINFLVSSSVIEFQDREAILSINRDITERKAAEEALRNSEEQLQQAQKMESIGTLAGGVAHDFNNLLTAINGYSDLALRKLKQDDPLCRNLTEIKKAGERAATLTRQLLAFSRRQTLERKSVNLNESIADMMKMLTRIIGEDVDIRFTAAGDLQKVYADAGQIEQVVMNLAVNARDAMPDGGRVLIETDNVALDDAYCRRHPHAKPGRYARLLISDTGTGMDAETMARIFEPFFTTKEVGKGTGLGLSMVYGIVKQHDGFIEVYSEVGQGTIFKIYLPVEDKPATKTLADTPPVLRGGTETILLAEDEKPLRELARDMLTELGYTVLLASDGQEALELYQANYGQINMVMLDVVMPRLGGHKAYEQMRKLSDNVAAIFMTGYSTEMARASFGEDVGAALLQKPYSFEALGCKVREKLDEAHSKKTVAVQLA